MSGEEGFSEKGGEAMAKIICRPMRVGTKPGPKPIYVKPHKRSRPKPIRRGC